MKHTVDQAERFRMPGCLRKHFLSGYKRRCRRCNEEVERQFRDVCEAYWALIAAAKGATE